jgi:protein gp37
MPQTSGQTAKSGAKGERDLPLSKIEWCDFTFSPWWGCTEVSPACDNCYAREMAAYMGKFVWGKDAPRLGQAEGYWRQTLVWNERARRTRKRFSVFCASMCDIFEDVTPLLEAHRKTVEIARRRLFDHVIPTTPYLIWLLLTKRPQNIRRYVPGEWLKEPPHNVRYGTSAETPFYARQRIPQLTAAPAAGHFMSIEPLLGSLILKEPEWKGVDWIIVGGESGPKARPMADEWALDLLRQARENQFAFFMKQMGGRTSHRAQLSQIPDALRIREVPGSHSWDALPGIYREAGASQDTLHF